MASLLGQPSPEFPRRRRFARALQTEKQNHARMRLRRRQSTCRVSEQREHFVAHDSYDLLRRSQALENFLIDGAVAHPIDERLDDLEIDVSLEERHANFAQRGLDRRFGQSRFASKRAKYSLQAVAERF